MYEEIIIIILVAYGTILTFFLYILYKRLQTIISYNNSLEKNLNNKVDKIVHIIDTLPSMKFKSENFSNEQSYLKKYLLDVHTTSEKINSNILKFEKMLSSEYVRNTKPSFPSSNHTEIQSENKMDMSVEIKNILNDIKEEKFKENEINISNNISDGNTNSDLSNNSANEIKSLEREILIALKKLEKAELNSKQQQNN